MHAQPKRPQTSNASVNPLLVFYCRLPAVPRHLRSVHLPFRATLFLPVCASAPKHHVACKLAPDTAANPAQISAYPIRTVDFRQRAARPTPLPPSPIHNSRARRRSRKRTRDRVLDTYARPSFACFQVVVETALCHPERSECSSSPPVIPSAANAVSGVEGSLHSAALRQTQSR